MMTMKQINSAAGNIIGSLTALTAPGVHHVLEKFLNLPEALGEGAMVLWLLVKGVKNPTVVVSPVH